ncbi:MAG: sulfur carrier protein ThiS [Deltaproteobacteria bacterium]|nr:sulfur carrier protein ThiS [Deltaproteobacteria bacterium]
MRVIVNGQDRNLDDETTLAELLDELNVPRRFVAVEYNGEPFEGEQTSCRLRDGDRLEVVRFVGGG